MTFSRYLFIVVFFVTLGYGFASTNCTAIVQLANDLGIQVAQPLIWSALQTDCCIASGVTCVGQNVSKIDWHGMGLNGIINDTAIPSTVTVLDLHSYSLNGNFPISLPSKLTFLDVSHNTLTNNLPPMFPVGLLTLHVHDNKLSGDLPFFPSKTKDIILGWPGSPRNNHFTGTLRSNRPILMYINDNWITNIIIQDNMILH